jgi:hypothetical protein
MVNKNSLKKFEADSKYFLCFIVASICILLYLEHNLSS